MNFSSCFEVHIYLVNIFFLVCDSCYQAITAELLDWKVFMFEIKNGVCVVCIKSWY